MLKHHFRVWSEARRVCYVLCMCIICISACIPKCCCMSAFYKSTWRCYSSYSYMNCTFAFLFLILWPLFRYTEHKVRFCTPWRLAWRSRLTVCVFLFVCSIVFCFLLPQFYFFSFSFSFFLCFSLLYLFSFCFFCTVFFYFSLETMSSG